MLASGSSGERVVVGVAEADGVTNLVLEHAREADVGLELRVEIRSVLEDHVRAGEREKLRAADRPAAARSRIGGAAADSQDEAGKLVVGILK